MDDLETIYRKLLSSFGRQGWWPCSGSFDPPEWEICVGAILTQNTSWKNVEKALEGMKRAGLTGIGSLLGADIGRIEKAIMPSGFYRQKASRLKGFAGFVAGFGGFNRFSMKVTREQLLSVKGLGPETADSMLLYGLGRPCFVIDAYTRRVFTRMGFDGRKGYEEWRSFFESGLPKDVDIYKEFHALIVELAKRHCKKKPLCDGCPLGGVCGKLI